MSNLAGCAPIGAPTNSDQRIRSYFHELQGLSPEEYRGVVIPMYITVNTANRAGNGGTAQYRVPSSHKLAIERIRGYVAMPAWQTNDADASSTVVSTTALPGMRLAKAMTTLVTLTNTDRNQKIFEGTQSLNLAAILDEPIDWTGRPHLVEPAELLELTISWADLTTLGSVPASAGQENQYGIILEGYLVRTGRT